MVTAQKTLLQKRLIVEEVVNAAERVINNFLQDVFFSVRKE